jgi:hypothetical protein
MYLSLPYIAGFFDGEGSVGVYCRKDRSCFHLRTQLVQNASAVSIQIMDSLVLRFGGHYTRKPSKEGRFKLNWQLSSDNAARFLSQIEPYLLLKRPQVNLALAWQRSRPVQTRRANGQIRPWGKQFADYSYMVSCRLKAMKKDIEQVMANQADLVDIQVELTPMAVIKG